MAKVKKRSPLKNSEQDLDTELLASHLHFSPDDGHIQLFDQRMLLMHASSFAELRREMVSSLGSHKAKELLIKWFGKQIKDAIIKPNINKPKIKWLLPPWAIITPAPKLKSNIKVTPSVIQPNIQKLSALLPRS